MIVNLSVEQFARMWPTFEPLVKQVTDQSDGCFLPIDICLDVMAGRSAAWIGWDTEAQAVDVLIITTVRDFPRRRMLNLGVISGRNVRRHQAEALEVLTAYAHDLGCSAITGSFRRGWTRIWPGVRENGVSLIKDI